ncbi:hypothetical protein HJFPF1_10786 [Paramyrothecium foliicola]|nr:hypothetical protein HJFPF1_10786 [Paramyrothecium foliicola]
MTGQRRSKESEFDVLIGIDVGMSCEYHKYESGRHFSHITTHFAEAVSWLTNHRSVGTGVAYLNLKRGNEHVLNFKDWGAYKREDKVPTRLEYSDSRELVNWGFKCSPNGGEIVEWFKTGFGEDGHELANHHYLEYLTCLYRFLSGREELADGPLEAARVLFTFSYPAHWNYSKIAAFTDIARNAGFGSQDGSEINVRLSEPMAVAAFTLCEENMVKSQENLLVVDAGGGTVVSSPVSPEISRVKAYVHGNQDLCFVNVSNATKGQISLKDEQPVQGRKGRLCGSSFIDEGFEKAVKKRLEPLKDELSNTVEYTAQVMRMDGYFQDKKLNFGRNRHHQDDDADHFRIQIPGLKDKTLTDAAMNIRQGQMVFPRSLMTSLFDEQVKKIILEIDTIVNNHAEEHMSHQTKVHHVVMSGGLGSSPYVQGKIKKYIDSLRDSHILRKANTFVSSEPQFAVCRGLVRYAKQVLDGSEMIPTFLPRFSLGVVCRTLIADIKLDDKRVITKEAKKSGKLIRRWFGHNEVEGYVRWLVKRGQRVQNSPEPDTISHSVDLDSSTSQRRRFTEIVIVECVDKDPPSFVKGGVDTSCLFHVDLSQIDDRNIKQERKYGVGPKKPTIQVFFDIKVNVGMASIELQCGK